MNLFRKKSAVSSRERMEDALKHLLDCEQSERGATVESLAGALGKPQKSAAEILGQLRAAGLANAANDGHGLTEEGRTYALKVVRNHRLYETWLARETSTPAKDWHRAAHKAEHHLEAATVEAIADRLNNPCFDPHGDLIPTRDGHLPKRPLTSLASWQDGRAARIAHIEDEPEILYRKAEVLGFAPGTRIDGIQHLRDGSVECRVEGRSLVISAAVAPLIHLVKTADDDIEPANLGRLSDLPIGGEAEVHSLSPSCTGPERRRLLDLGVVPGTRIRCEFASPFGTPRSYDIRGALIALRDHQADRILINLSSS